MVWLRHYGDGNTSEATDILRTGHLASYLALAHATNKSHVRITYESYSLPHSLSGPLLISTASIHSSALPSHQGGTPYLLNFHSALCLSNQPCFSHFLAAFDVDIFPPSRLQRSWTSGKRFFGDISMEEAHSVVFMSRRETLGIGPSHCRRNTMFLGCRDSPPAPDDEHQPQVFDDW